MERFSLGLLEDIPQQDGPIEVAKTPRQKRQLPSRFHCPEAVYIWSTLAKNQSPAASTSAASRSAPAVKLETETVEPVEVAVTFDPPLLLTDHVVFGGSSTTSSLSSSSTPKKMGKRSSHVGCGSSGSKSSRSSSSKKVGKRSSENSVNSSEHLKRRLFNSTFFYGSEEDSPSDDEGEEAFQVSRVLRDFHGEGDVDYEGEEALPATINYQWPPQSVLQSTPEFTIINTETAETPSEDIQLDLNKFDFVWKPFSEPQIQPELRRETFSVKNCGPTIQARDPYDAFTAIWDHQIMEQIAIETNRYAQQLVDKLNAKGALTPSSRLRSWKDTNVDELYVLFAVILATGVTVKTRIEEYWNRERDIFSTPSFSTFMSYNRFNLLCKCLHFNNNNDCDPEVMTPSEAKLFKIHPITRHLNQKFSSLYVLNRNITLDKRFAMGKGWLDSNQYIPNKPTGIKTYELCESMSGYLWRFEIHAGRTSDRQENNPISGILPNVVLILLNGLEHKGHTIWMDSYFNSPALARELKIRGFDCVGTLRKNSQYLPEEMVSLKNKDLVKGQMFGCTSGDVDIVVWRDKSIVSLISTYHGLATVVHGNMIKPSIVPDYNNFMGGVDRKDQMTAMYPIERKRTNIWYKKMFRRLLNVSVLNAYILLHKTDSTITHRGFRKTLVRQLLDIHSKITLNTPTNFVGHFAAQFDLPPGQRERNRRVCAVCKKRTASFCKGCDPPVSLCVYTCFEPYHYGNYH